MKSRKNSAFVLALAMVFSLFAGLMSVNVSAEGEKAQVKLEVYEATSDGNFGSKLNIEGENKDSLKVGKEYIIAVQVYNFGTIVGEGGLNYLQLEMNYNSQHLHQAMSNASKSNPTETGYYDESNLSATGQRDLTSDYVGYTHVATGSYVGTEGEFSTDAKQFNDDLLWFRVKDEDSNGRVYQDPTVVFKKIVDAENQWIDNGVKIISTVESTGTYSANGTLRATAGNNKMMVAYKFLAMDIPTENNGETTISLQTAVDSSFMFSKWPANIAENTSQSSIVQRYSSMIADGILEEVQPISVKIEDPSDPPFIVDPDDPNADSEWANAVVKNLDENDKYQAGSVIHVKGIKRETDGTETVEDLPVGLNVKLFDKDGNQLYFGDNDTVATLENQLTVDTATDDFVIDLTRVRNADGSLISDQTLYLAVQEGTKGNSDKVEIAENSPAPVITEANAKKVVVLKQVI